MVRSPKHTEGETSLEERSRQRTERERAAFGDAPPAEEDHITEPEIWWSQHFQWLKDRGYLLRPRYAPDWTPSWKGTNKDSFLCEDGVVPRFATHLLDGTRLSDGQYVTLKIIRKSIHPYEVEIGQKFSSEPFRSNSANHCVPIYEVIPTPESDDKVIIVMPLLREYTSPSFCTIGEAVECFRQLFEGLSFMHKSRVAHRDCGHMNIMMDPTGLCIDAFHPVYPFMKRDYSGYARFKTRTRQPVKYYFIDFGLSRYYDPSIVKPLEVPVWGGDKEVPEFQNSNEPQDPFATDVFYIGNAIKQDFIESKHGFEFMQPLIADMVQNDPSKRPTMDEVVTRFETIRRHLSAVKLRSRVVDKEEGILTVTVRTMGHWIRQLAYVIRRLPAVPPPPPTS